MTGARPHIVIASQEVWPFVPGGGIGRHVSEGAILLAEAADVTIVTDGRWASVHAQLVADGDSRLAEGVRYVWVEDTPSDTSPFHSEFHFSSAAYWRAIRELAGERPIDLVEFDDFRGIGAVTIDAKRAGAPELADTTLAVRLHTSWEMTAVLNSERRDDLASRSVMALERLSLRFADRLLHPGERTYEAYRRFYGPDALAPSTTVAPAFVLPDASAIDVAAVAGGPLRLLYVGRLQELKGVLNLVRAVLALPDAELELTLVGRDTPTAPAGGSMLSYLERLVADDRRISFFGSAERDELDELIEEHHVVVVPSRFESYGYVVREALACNRPVLAAPVGGLVDGFVVGRSGWLARDGSAEGLAAALADLIARRGEIDALIAAGAPRASLEDALDSEAMIDGYRALAREGHDEQRADRRPLRERATALVLALTGDGPVTGTLTALEAQQGVELEIVLVTDDPARVPAADLARLHHLVIVQPGSRRTAARNAGLAARVARGPVLLVSAGNAPAPGFMARGFEALAARAAPAYMTAHGTGRDPANAPLGNAVADLLGDFGVSGEVALVHSDALAGGFPDGSDDCDAAALFRELAAAGRFGVVVPEPLAGAVRSRCRDTDAAARAMASVAAAHDLWAAR